MHGADAVLSYVGGILSGLQDMAQVLDSEHCHVPDYYIYKSVTCACNDSAVQIPLLNQTQGLAEFAHWCTGTLSMVSSFGREVFIYNKYSFAELKRLLQAGRVDGQPSRIDNYLKCLSNTDAQAYKWDRCSRLKPVVDDITNQGVSPIAVLQRCKANYQQGRWDPGAWLLYDQQRTSGIHIKGAAPVGVRYGSVVGDCLMDAENRGEPNTGCMQDFLSKSFAQAFRYDRIGNAARDYDSTDVDACQIFTGPASHLSATIAKPFKQCATGWEENDCRIPLIGWSGGSTNRVPVANAHAIDTSDQLGRKKVALSDFADIKKNVLSALSSLSNFTDNNLKVYLFSAEGDALHQAMDCYVMGPYSRVDFWSPGSDKKLPVPFWARDASGTGASRVMDTPCNGGKTDGDHIPPFTCGSGTRRSLIKSFVRNFINDRQRGNSLTEELVQARIKKLIEVWSNDSNYGCDCARGAHPATSLDCCTAATATQTDNYLPRELGTVGFDLLESNVVSEAVMNLIGPFFDSVYSTAGNAAFMNHRTPAFAHEPATWKWSTDTSNARRAVRDGLFVSHSDIVQYDQTEIGWPFVEDKTIWEQCVGLVSQSMFTLPMTQIDLNGDTEESVASMWSLVDVVELRALGLEFDPVANVNFEDVHVPDDGSNLSMLERYVRRLLKSAYHTSPLFWHHAMRHTPSESLFCKGSYEEERKTSGASIHFKNLQDIQVPALNNLRPIAWQGINAHPVGATGVDCLCGWRILDSMCQVPTEICIILSNTSNCNYLADSVIHANRMEALVRNQWTSHAAAPGWVCPEMDMSDAWGILPSVGLPQWFQNSGNSIEVSVGELLVRGRAGLRVGNIDSLLEEGRKQIHPGARVHGITSVDGKSHASLQCITDKLKSFDSISVAKQMVDDLFPAARAVQEAAVVSACLRFSIEYTQLRVLQMLNKIRDTGEATAKQQAHVEKWRLKCEVQLDLMGMCKTHGVYQIRPVVERVYKCPFTIVQAYALGLHYVTPGCMVYKFSTDEFYDPCLDPNNCNTNSPAVDLLTSMHHLVVPFDPRATVKAGPIGYWPIAFDTARPVNDSILNDLKTRLDTFDAKSPIPRALSERFVSDLVHGGGSNARGFGNVPSTHKWGTSEGSAKDSTMFCDGVSDWWPDDWIKPIGYHVTLPCHHSETAYRTFDSVFAVDESNPANIKMVYQHNTLRDRQSTHSEYGASGLCRKGTYGMPRAITNTMRVCTRDSKDAMYDASVPVKPVYNGTSTVPVYDEGSIRCADSPYETPWFIEDASNADPNMLSVGGVPMWDGNYEDATYPIGSVVNKAGAGETQWGTDCHEGKHFSCDATQPCISMDPVNAPLECVRGVCVMNRATSNTCYSHADCEATGQLCTGDGYCSDGVYQIENDFSEEIEFQIHSTHCNGVPGGPNHGQLKPDSYNTVGTSPWEHVPDILQMHGMCSYRNWFEFVEFAQSTDVNRSAVNAAASCQDAQRNVSLCRAIDSDSTKAMWWDSDLQAGVRKFPTLWETKRFRMHPHTCDRDYMHIDGFAACVPFVTDSPLARTGFVTMHNRKISPRLNPRGRTMKTFGQDHFVPVMPMPIVGMSPTSWKSSGFLSMDVQSMTLADETGHPFVRCSDVKQCQSDVFRVDGSSIERKVTRNIDAIVLPWQQAWSTNCGMFGRIVNSLECELDLAVMPLYWAVCTDANNKPYYNAAMYQSLRTTCSKVTGFDTTQQCRVILNTYTSVPTQRAAAIIETTAALNDLINMISQNVQTGDAYIAAMGCTIAIYDVVQLDPHGFKSMYNVNNVRALYYFLKHTTVEIPFALWLKCMVLGGIRTIASYGGAASDLTCDGWRNPIAASQSVNIDFSDNPMARLKRINGVITSGMVLTARQKMGIDMQKLFTIYTSALNTPTKAPFFHSGTVFDMKLTCEKMPLLNFAMTLDSKVKLLKWGTRGMGLAKYYQLANNNGPSPEGVPDDCFVRAEPYILNEKKLPTRNIDTFTSGPKTMSLFLGKLSPAPWTGLQMIHMQAQYIAEYAVRAVDFVSDPTVNGVGYIVMSEFNPVNPPPLVIDSANSAVVVESSRNTKEKDIRTKMAKSIPCVTPDEVERSFKCDDKIFDEILKPGACQADRQGITAQILNLRADLLAKQKLINGELRTGTIDVKNDMSKLTPTQQTQIAVIIVGVGYVCVICIPLSIATYLAQESQKTHKERIPEDDNLPLWPQSLQDLVFKRLVERENACISVQSQVRSAKKYCTTPYMQRKKLNLFSDAGQDFITFQAKVVADEYKLTLTSDGKVLPEEFGKDVALAPASDDNLQGSSPVYQRFNFVGTQDAPAHKRNKDEINALIEAIGAQKTKDITDQRDATLEKVMQTVENILALVAEPSYYDCTEKYSNKVCIRENIVVDDNDLNENMTQSDETIRKLDGANGCLALSIPVGERNCLWYMHDGIQAELDELNILTALGSSSYSREEIELGISKGQSPECYDGYQFKHPVSARPLDLRVDCERLPKIQSKAYTTGGPVHRFTDDTDGVQYAVYMRMIAELMSMSEIPQDDQKWPAAIKSAMSARGLPVSHVIFDIGSGFNSDTAFNLAAARANDNHIDALQVFTHV